MIELPLIFYVVAFLVGCIPLACCILVNIIAEWSIERKRKNKW